MAFRFRRSFRILPGVRFNVSKTGSSWSLGRRGATVNISRRGVKRTVGVPGTGLSYSSFSPAQHRAGETTATLSVPPLPEPAAPRALAADYARFDIPETSARRRVLVIGGILTFGSLTASAAGAMLAPENPLIVLAVPGALFLVGVLAIVVGLAMASRATLFNREQARRRDEFTRAVKAVSCDDLKQVNALFALKERLHLRDDEADPTYFAIAQGVQDVLTYQEEVARNGNQFPPIEGIGEPVTPDEQCYLVAPVSVDARGQHGPARLYLTNARLVLQADQVTSIPWSKISVFENSGLVCQVQRVDRQTAMTIRFEVLGAALRAELLAKNLLRRVNA